MKFINIAAVAASIPLVSATPLLAARGKAPAGHEYVAPKPTDSRGPCPALNSFANHGFLPHNGKDITVAKYVDACKKAMNVDSTFSFPQGNLALQSNCTTATKMSLHQLRNHDILIEHDASLAHQDHFFGSDFTINQRSLDMFIGGFNGAKFTSLASASHTKYGRVHDSLTKNPKVKYGPRELLFSYIETALYLQVLGRSLTSGVAPLSYVKVLFGEERLPYAEGWTPGPEVNEASLGSMAVLLQPLGPHPGDEGIYAVTKGAIQETIEGKFDLDNAASPRQCSKP